MSPCAMDALKARSLVCRSYRQSRWSTRVVCSAPPCCASSGIGQSAHPSRFAWSRRDSLRPVLLLTISGFAVRLASLRKIKATQPLRESGICQNPLILRCVAASLMLSRGVRSSALPLRRDLKFPQSTMIGCNQSVHRPSGTDFSAFARASRLSCSGLLSCSRVLFW